MKDCGIAVVTANNWDTKALEAAFQGCWAVYVNIDSDNPVSEQNRQHVILGFLKC